MSYLAKRRLIHAYLIGSMFEEDDEDVKKEQLVFILTLFQAKQACNRSMLHNNTNVYNHVKHVNTVHIWWYNVGSGDSSNSILVATEESTFEKLHLQNHYVIYNKLFPKKINIYVCVCATCIAVVFKAFLYMHTEYSW